MVQCFKFELGSHKKRKKRDDSPEEGQNLKTPLITINEVVNETSFNSSNKIETLYKTMIFKVIFNLFLKV